MLSPGSYSPFPHHSGTYTEKNFRGRSNIDQAPRRLKPLRIDSHVSEPR